MPTPPVRFVGPSQLHTPAARATQVLLDALQQREPLRRSVTARRVPIRAGGKLLQMLRSALATMILLLSPTGPFPRLILPVHTRLDACGAIPVAWAGRMRGYRIFICHGVGRFVSHKHRLIHWLNRAAGRRCIHLVPTEDMISRLRWIYRTQQTCMAATLPVNPLPEPTPDRAARLADRAIHLGVIHDLGADPALSDALNTFDVVTDRVGRCRLICCGQVVKERHRRMLDDARRRYAQAVEERGDLDEEGWQRFFADIDVLLVPARQTDDPWPAVLIRAMAAGVPVIARASGSLRTLIGDEGGSVIDVDADFPRKAMRLIAAWAHDPSKFAQASAAAARRGREVAERARRQFDAVLDQITITG